MPGYLYIVSVMSAGLLSVLLLALRTEKTRCKAVDDALAKLPGIRPERRLSAGRRALAIDDRSRALCVICAETQTVRLHVVPFADLRASELWVDGKPVSRVERGSLFESVMRRRQQTDATGDVRLRIEVRDHHAPVHELTVADVRLAKYWHSQLRAMIAATEPVERIVAAAAPQRPAAAPGAGVDRRAAVQPGVAHKSRGAGRVAESAGAYAQAGDRARPVADTARQRCDDAQQPARGSQNANAEDANSVLSPQLRAALRRYLSNTLQDEDRMVISERKLRDACAPKLSLIRFHDQMNRLRRAKALTDYRLSYSRKTETWRISRAEDRRAAAA